MKLIAGRVAILMIISILLICLPCLLFAQSVDCPDLPDPDVPCPIDSWVVMLLVVGGVYGVRKAGLFRKKLPNT